MRRAIILSVIILSSLLGYAQNQTSKLKEFAPNLYLMKPDAYKLKVVVAEFDDYTALVEFPVNDTVVNSIIEQIKQKFPNKPIKYVFHSHHHLHAASGFDPFLESTEAQLVTSPYNYEKIKAMTKDSLKLAQRYIEYDSVFTLKSNNNELKSFMVKRTDYATSTKEYNIVYFPKQKVVISGCLYQKPLEYHQVVNARKKAIKDIITDKGMDVKYLIPTNSCKESGYENICTIEMLDSTLQFGLKPDEIADYFESKSLKYLKSKQDSIKQAIKKIPKSYDYYLCARTLMKRESYDRAIFLFGLLPELYTDYSHNLFLYSGDCYKHKGKKRKAKKQYKKYLAHAINDWEINRGKEKIEALHKE